MRYLFILFFIGSLPFLANAQRTLSFEGFARTAEGKGIGNANIGVRFTIHDGAPTPTNIYVETQTVRTDAYGIFKADIGASSAPVLGVFANIDFSIQEYHLRVETNFGGNFITISDGKLTAAPYAKSSDRAIEAENGVAIGTIVPFGGGAIPAGYLPCDGSSISTTTYAGLFAVIEYNWGGTGANFNVPDLRGYFLRGVDLNGGVDPDGALRTALNPGGNAGRNVGSRQGSEVKSHKHQKGDLEIAIAGNHSHAINQRGDGSGEGLIIDTTNNGGNDNNTGSDGDHDHSVTGSTANTGTAETRPKNAYVNFIRACIEFSV